MSRGSPELTKARKEEIINAFEELFFTMSYRDISMREIEQKITCLLYTSDAADEL